MKTICLIIIVALLFSCQDIPTNYNLIPKEIKYSGHWTVTLSSNDGGGTIKISNSGEIENGVVIKTDSTEYIFYISGEVKNDGKLNADFNNKNTLGKFIGTFNDTTAQGYYLCFKKNQILFSGNWVGKKLF